jgi:hypothetical protein
MVRSDPKGSAVLHPAETTVSARDAAFSSSRIEV